MTKYILFSFILLLPATILAQPTIANPNTSIGDNLKSPQVHLLKQFADHPVDLSRGLVDVSVPIYDIQFKDKKIPINLMFHASGLKASASENGMLGLKWAMNIGGFISREVRGYPDELRDHKQGINQLYAPDWMTLYGASNYLRYGGNYIFTDDLNFSYHMGMPNGAVGKYEDTEYDIFTFTLPNGESGKFILKDDNGNKSASFMSYKPYKLNNPLVESNIHEKSFTKFEIIDAEGYIYTFGKSDLGQSYYTDAINSEYINCWQLTSITSPNKKDTIRFDYIFNTVYSKNSAIPVTVNDNLEDYNTYSTLESCGADSVLYKWLGFTLDNSFGYFIKNYNEPAMMDEHVFNLSKITYNDLIVDFIYINGGLLNEIKISNANTIIKKASFDIKTPSGVTPFMSGNNYLNSVNIMSSSNEVIEKYSFDYYGLDKLPTIDKLCNSADYWGYYNSQIENEIMHDTIDILLTRPGCGSGGNIEQVLQKEIGKGNNRYSNIEDMKIGMIKSITYPTGGATTFEYDGNKYLDGNTIRECGGLVIKKITEKDKNGIDLKKKEFVYGQAEDGIGEIPVYLKPSIYHRNYFKERETECYIVDDYTYFGSHGDYDILVERGVGTYTTRYITGLFPSNYYTFLYNLVSYDKVTEYSGDSNNNVGKTEYYYSTNIPLLKEYEFDYNKFHYGNYEYTVDPSHFWYGNHLSKKIEYKRNNGLYSKVKQSDYLYSEDIVDTFYDLPILKFKTFVVYSTKSASLSPSFYGRSQETNLEELNQFKDNPGEFCGYKLQTYTIGIENLSEIKEETFLNGGSVITNTVNTYDTNKPSYLKENTTTNSKGEIITQKYLYPFNINTGVYSQMTTANVISPLIEKVSLKNNLVTNSVLLTYKKSNDNFVPEKNYIAELNNPLPYSSFANFNGLTKDSRYSSNTEYTYDSYDAYGNPTQITSKGGIITSYIWGYDKKYPVTKIENAAYASIPPSLITAIETASSITGTEAGLLTALTNLRNDLSVSDAMVSTYTYKPLIGLNSITDPKGDIVTYSYDSFGRLQNIKNKDGNILSENKYHYKN